MSPVSLGFHGRRSATAEQTDRVLPGGVRNTGLPRAVGRPDTAHAAEGLGLLDPAGREDEEGMDVAGDPGAAHRDRHRGHPDLRPCRDRYYLTWATLLP